MATKPTYKPELATTDITLPEAGTDNKIRPSEVTREVGYDFRQYLPVQEYNYQWHLTNQWINYFEEVTDDIGVTEVATEQEALDGLDNSKIITPLRNRQFASQYGLGNTSAQATNIEDPSLDSLTTSGEFSVVNATGGPTSLGGTVTGILTVSTRPFTSGSGDQTICHQRLVSGDETFQRFQDQTGAWSLWRGINHIVGDGVEVVDNRLNLSTPTTLSSTSDNEVTPDGHSHEIDLASFFTTSRNETGYVLLPGGICLQWGHEPVGDNTTSNVTLPYSGATQIFSLNVTPKYSSSMSDSHMISTHGVVLNPTTIRVGLTTNVSWAVDGAYWFVVGMY